MGGWHEAMVLVCLGWSLIRRISDDPLAAEGEGGHRSTGLVMTLGEGGGITDPPGTKGWPGWWASSDRAPIAGWG